MARTEQERSGCVTGLWSLFRPKKAHKGDNKVHPEAMDAAASKLKVQDRVCEAVSGEAMDAAALKLKELKREVKIVLEAIRQERGHKEPIKPIKPEQEKEDEEENQEKKAEQLKEEKKAEQVNEEEKEADQMKPMKLEQEEAEKQLKEEEQEKKAEQLSEEEQEKEAHETKELRREVKQEQGHKEQPQLEREEKNQPIKPIKPMKQEQEQEEEQQMKPMKQQLEHEEEQTIKPIKQPLEREDDQEKMKQQENDKPNQEEQRPKPILLPAGGRRPGSRPKMVRFSSSAEDILPDGTRRRSETHLSDGRGGYVEFAYLEALHKANRWLNQRGKTEKKICSLEEEKREETEEEKYEEKSWSVSALRILIRLTEQLYEELNGKSSDRERIKRARKMMRLQKMLDRIPSERKPWKKLQSGEVVFVKEAKELYDRAGRDFVAEFKRRQRAGVNDECLFCRNHDGEKMIGRAGRTRANCSKHVEETRNEVGSELEKLAARIGQLEASARTLASEKPTLKSRIQKLDLQATVQDVKAAGDNCVSGLQAEKSITLRASKQASDQPPHSSKSREDQWIKLDYTLQCLEQAEIYLISFPVDGDDSGVPAALRLLVTGVSDGCGDYKTDYARCSLSSGGMREVFGQEFLKEKPQGIMADGVESAARADGEDHGTRGAGGERDVPDAKQSFGRGAPKDEEDKPRRTDERAHGVPSSRGLADQMDATCDKKEHLASQEAVFLHASAQASQHDQGLKWQKHSLTVRGSKHVEETRMEVQELTSSRESNPEQRCKPRDILPRLQSFGDILINREIADNFVKIWASQAELAETVAEIGAVSQPSGAESIKRRWGNSEMKEKMRCQDGSRQSSLVDGNGTRASMLSRIALGAWMIEDDDGKMISNSKKLLVAVEPEVQLHKD
ncbi:hypothetical protein SELMODRAFT_421660 [Selaginella moellendorffii]|uniref:Uncharacterized protein n=1 Tax=Selaginella moellendorffii TaxID=88036 RepID=D8SFY8_SELML|nr:hypothetical protein SELMODRAFT_421660 [Selaginella moellendorffii]